jgi:diguanylate cyclase (GGDEF)-like protein
MGLYVMLNDITRHHDQTQSLRDNQQRLHLLTEAAREGIVLLRDQQIAEINDVLCQWIGMPREALIGRPWSEFAGSITSPTGLRDGDGHPLPVEVLPTEHPSTRSSIELQARVVRHLGDSQLARLRLDHLRYHDGLTGALNREGFHQRLSVALTTPLDSGAWGVLQIGIDRIETLEEALGSPLTDALLIELTHRLRERLRSTDALASSGRGEFLIMARLDSLSALGPLARRLLQALEKPIQLNGQAGPLETGASIGCALCPAPGSPQEAEQSIELVLRQALRALDQVRQRGGSDIQEAGHAQSWGRVVDLQRESRGRSAMEQGHLALHFQPQLRCTDGAPVGAAATLVRRHIDGHWLEWTLPGAADQLQAPLIRRISLWMLKTAVQAIRRWQPAGMPPWFSIVLPLSAPQLMSPEFATQVGHVLEDERIPGHWIEFDLEPDAVIHTPEAMLESRITALRQLGVRLSVEPLGDVAIAPSRLRNLGVEKFRIGRSCVSGLPGDALSAVTARAVLDLARSRGLSVTADQVDTEAQHRFLVENGCDFVQGSVIGPRMNTAELAAWLAQTGLSPLVGEEEDAATGGGILNPS